MKPPSQIVSEVSNAVCVAAGATVNNAGQLRCSTCGTEVGITPREVARYLRSGWPRCCGYTMRWVTVNELKKESEAPNA